MKTPIVLSQAFLQFRVSRLHAWKALQILGKPLSPRAEAVANRLLDMIGAGGARDRLGQQKWWTLKIDDRPSPWQTTTQTPAWVVALGRDQEWIRRRAELAMWYPALAAPAGVAPLEPLNGTSGMIEGLPRQGPERRHVRAWTGGRAAPDRRRWHALSLLCLDEEVPRGVERFPRLQQALRGVGSA